jgi:hypothetical protein
MPAAGEFFSTVFRGGFKDAMAAFKEHITAPWKEQAEKLGKSMFDKKSVKMMWKTGQIMKGIGAMALGPLNVVLSVLDALGIAEPFLDVIGGILEILGGAVMEAMAPALEVFAEVLSDPEVVEALTTIGTIIGVVLTPIVKAFALALKGLAWVFNKTIGIFKGIGKGIVGFFTKLKERSKKSQEKLKEASVKEYMKTGFISPYLRGTKFGDWVKKEGEKRLREEQLAARAKAMPAVQRFGGGVVINIQGNADAKTLEELIDKVGFDQAMGYNR